MSAGVYTLPAGGTDPQEPHKKEDEMYYVVRGRARMRVGAADRAISQGSVMSLWRRKWNIASTTLRKSL